VTAADGHQIDPGAMIRSRGYVALLVLAAVIGLIVSLAGWAFLELTERMQHWVYLDLPGNLGFSSAPWWWPLPILLVAGIAIAFAIVALPGAGGHRPASGLATGAPVLPGQLPGVMLAAIAGIGLGVVLGPEAPLLALGSGLGLLTVSLVRKGAPQQVKLVMAAAGSFAAISTVFGNPMIGAVIIIEAAGLSGPTLPLVLLPGLLAAGIGSVVFIGMGQLTALSTSAYALPALNLPASGDLTIADFVAAIAIAILVAIVVRLILELAWRTETVILARPMVLIPAAAVVVGLIAIAFAQLTGQPASYVLFSGQDAMPDVVEHASALSSAVLLALILFKGLAWSVSLGSFRGGPTFPAIFIGLVGGLLAVSLFGLPEAAMIGAGMGATTVAMLRLPLSSVILATVVTQAGLATAPLIILAVVVAYIATELLGERRRRFGESSAISGEGGAAEPASVPSGGAGSAT
jgi:H+/Cl- antiporter ClcA